MKRTNLKCVFLFHVFAFMVMGLMFTGCGKNGPNPTGPDAPNFKPSDFEIIITNQTVFPSSYAFFYEVKNLKNESFDYTTNDGDYWIRFTVKTTDGSQYQEENPIEMIQANGTSAQHSSISYTQGKTIDAATFRYEVYLNE